MSSVNSKIKIGIVGCGYWGINYVRVFNELHGAIVANVCDQDDERRQLVQKRFQAAQTSQCVKELLKSDVDAVVIATPASTHFEVALECLKNNKHVLLEKPITTNADDAARLIEKAQGRGLILMVGHTFLFNAGVHATKEYLTSDEFGKAYYLHATRTNLGPIRHDVNAIWDLAPHDLSIFWYFLDESPEWVSAVGKCVLGNCREDVAFITLGYSSGILGNIHVSWADPNKVREVVAVGSRMRIVFNDLDSQERVRVFNKGVAPISAEAESFGEYRFLLREGEIVSPVIQPSEPLKNQCAYFLDCIQDECCGYSNGEMALNVVQVLEAVDRSIAQKGMPVAV